MNLKIVYEDNNLLVIDKPAGIVVFPEGKNNDGEPRRTIVDLLVEYYPNLKEVGRPPRYGIVHRLDKDTSGILLVAKNSQTLAFLQKQFKERQVEKKYLALVTGSVKDNSGVVETLIGRSPKDRKKQKVFLPAEPDAARKRTAVTEYKVLARLRSNGATAEQERFDEYTLLEVTPKTGRKHQIRTHMAHLGNPVAGDSLYGFKNQPKPKGLTRHFLHASYLKIKLPDNKYREFYSGLPEDLKKVVDSLKMTNI